MKMKKLAMATLIMTTLGGATLFAQTGIVGKPSTAAAMSVNDAAMQTARLDALHEAMVNFPATTSQARFGARHEMRYDARNDARFEARFARMQVASYEWMGNGVENYLRLMAVMPQMETVRPAVDMASRRLNSPRVAAEAALLYAALPKIPMAVGPQVKN